ncbi:MAG: caspase family protein [Myxococcales bacterium]|nr:caspase family protein [Myxococcales bacterium]
MSERVALLIGAPDDRLRGVEGDLERMEEALAGHDFASERLYGAAATRRGVLEALDALASSTAPGDAVVIYYSGHGGEIANRRANRTRGGELHEPAFYRCLIPTDIRESTATDFRGVLSIELDARVAAIAERSANVTLLVDCCHSEGVFRKSDDPTLTVEPPLDPAARTYTLGAPWLAPIEALRASLRGAGIDPDSLAPEADPRVVRLAACSLREIAVEAGDERGRAGLFTMHLAALLTELRGQTTTWLELGRQVRQRVMRVRPRQRPVLKGPAARLLFSLDEAPRRRTLAVVGDPREPKLGGGAMAGVELDDRFFLAPLARGASPLAETRVTRVDAASAEITRTSEGDSSLEEVAAAVALPLRYARPRGHVRLRTSPAVAALLRAALPASGIVAVAEDSAEVEAIAEVVEVANTLQLLAPSGAPLRRPLALRAPVDGHLPAVLRCITETLEALALSHALSELEPSPAQALDRDRAGWSLRVTGPDGAVVEGAPEAFSRASPLPLGRGARLVATLRNARGLAEAVFGGVLSICPSGHVDILSARHPWGATISADEPYRLGERIGGKSEGIEVTASALLPPDGPRLGELVLVAADGQADLRSWERAPPRFDRAELLDRTPATRLAARGDNPLPGHATKFAVWHVPADLRGALRR